MHIIDLTLEIDEHIQVFPDSPKVNILQWSNFDNHKYASEVWFSSTHVGTHVDAPYHFQKHGITVEKIPLSRLTIYENIKVLKIEKEDDEKIEVDDLRNYDIMKNDTILINTNWILNRALDKYFNKNPGLSEAAAKYLVEAEINLVGIDGPSIDPATDHDFNSHRIFSANDIPIIENLMNLDKLLNKKFTFVALPLKLKNCSGSPVRALAIMA
ncbi:cyclase family protein [soil metagenome]